MNLLNRKTELQREMIRRTSKKRSLLKMFQEEGELTTRELIRYFGTGCSSRIYELRKEGHVIVCVLVKPGLYKYVYKGKKEENDLPDNWDLIKAQASEDETSVSVID